MNDKNLALGARNLLVNCANMKLAETLLIVQEDPELGWYDASLAEYVKSVAEGLGVMVTNVKVGAPENNRSPSVLKAINAHDCTIFFARVGDQDRFAAPVPGKRSVMCYARDCEMLASSYGWASFQAFKEMKEAVNNIIFAAKRIEISCPLGTEFCGEIPSKNQKLEQDVGLQRFPLGVAAPVPADQFSGRIALAHYLTPTGSKVYDPSFLKLETTSFVEVAYGKILSFSGDTDEVRRIENHYDCVSRDLNIERNHVHSWHGGIHPGCNYQMDAFDDPDRWSNSVFTNPRFLHVHTCGNYAPGEICWMLLDPTVFIDGARLWDKGRLMPNAFAKTEQCIERWPELAPLFENPAQSIGLPL